MTNINKVELNFIDKKNRMGTLTVNGQPVQIGFVSVLKADGFNCKDEYSARLANDWNMSNPIVFQAKTPKGLISKIKRHQYNLVKF